MPSEIDVTPQADAPLSTWEKVKRELKEWGATLAIVAPAFLLFTGLLYEQLGQTCVPAATNVGVFWPKRGILRRPGLAVMEFLPPIAPGLAVPDFMARIEAEVETASSRLMRDAGWQG